MYEEEDEEEDGGRGGGRHVRAGEQILRSPKKY